ncbi:protein LURP-one-related 10-like [Cornus florida]|uniref:protein LURP-one-related 10-like n=1 Tax=Cornus florida TaxID=4283 RepID=UPI0028971B6F|nr:protein LURP-one-related 10-like [Cornus florida]
MKKPNSKDFSSLTKKKRKKKKDFSSLSPKRKQRLFQTDPCVNYLEVEYEFSFTQLHASILRFTYIYKNMITTMHAKNLREIESQIMAQPLSNPIPIVGTQFCAPYPVDLGITRKVLTITDGNFIVTDVNGNVMFDVKGSFLSLHDRRVILDVTGKPILTLRQKILTAHQRWRVYRGDSSDSKDLIFTAKTSSIIQIKTNLDVFLTNNTTEDHCDFKVKGSWLERSCVVYAGDSSTIVAQMHKKHSVQSVLLGKDKFMVTVYPNVDYAFIVALMVILDEVNRAD